MFPLKYILLGLSGAGLVGGGVATWQLTKNNSLKNQDAADRRYQEYIEELKKECGIDIWNISEEKGTEEENEKGKNYDDYDSCKDDIMKKHYPDYYD